MIDGVSVRENTGGTQNALAHHEVETQNTQLVRVVNHLHFTIFNEER